MKISTFFLLAWLLEPIAAATKLRGERRLSRFNDDEEEFKRRQLKKDDSKDDKDDKDDNGSVIPGAVSCFSGTATVLVKDVGPVPMEDLKVGSMILAGSNGEYQPVYAFGHFDPDNENKFLQIHTSGLPDHQPLEMTKEHLVFVYGRESPVRADSIRPGDVLSSASGGVKVTKIKTVTRKGLYAPFTPDGTLVVDGILASSYISMQDNAKEYVQVEIGAFAGGILQIMPYHDYVHMGLSPFRLACLGVSSRICTTYDEVGMPYYASFAIGLNKWASRQNVVVHSLVLLLVAALTGTCLFLETVFGATMAPTVVLFVCLAFIMVKKHQICIRTVKAKTL